MTPHGSVNFYNTDQGIQAYGEVTKLMPNHTYAMHIHEKGKCGNNGEDSGGHFNPYNTKHGN
ncbi:superoxide dismutase family protein, partial [Burkholderia mallei]|uniref:superoxide dismutase family protein n=1 Tax=Burkholderia mallei TaxID=13373 RepID=UPI0015CC0B44